MYTQKELTKMINDCPNTKKSENLCTLVGLHSNDAVKKTEDLFYEYMSVLDSSKLRRNLKNSCCNLVLHAHQLITCLLIDRNEICADLQCPAQQMVIKQEINLSNEALKEIQSFVDRGECK